MILADKVTELRKRKGWSQEALAHHLGVSRQAISKWESAQATPDLERILAMSEVFGVSTDVLIKDELELESVVGYPSDDVNSSRSNNSRDLGHSTGAPYTSDHVRQVSMEEANAYLRTVNDAAKPLGMGVALCVFSLVPLLVLAGLSDDPAFGISEALASAIGLGALCLTAACGVVLIVLSAMRLSAWSWLGEVGIETAYGVSGMVKQRREDFRPRLITHVTAGVALCIVAIAPLLILGVLSETPPTSLVSDGVAGAVGLGAMFSFAAVAVYLFVPTAIRWEAFAKLLEEGDYSRAKKRNSHNPFLATFASVYWLLVVTVFLAYSFLSGDWGRSWIIWPVAGCLFAALQVGIAYWGEHRNLHRDDK